MVEPNQARCGRSQIRQQNLQRDTRRLIVGGFSFLSSLLMPRRTGMFGEKLKLITMQCCVCERWTTLRVDPEHLERHRSTASTML